MEKNLKMLSIAVVGILLVAGCATGVYLMTRDDAKMKNVDATVSIYGNANNDFRVDSADVEMIRSIADGKTAWNKESNPYADANNDGNVTQEDADLVEKIIRNEPCKIFYKNYFGEAQQISFPLVNKKIAVTYWQQAEAVAILDHWSDVVVASKAVTVNKSNQYDLAKVTEYGSTGSSSIPDDGIEKMIQNGVDLIIATPSVSVKTTCDKLMTDRGWDVVYLWYAGDYCIPTILTLGILMNSEEKAEAYAEYCTDIVDTIKGRVSSSGKTPSMVITMMYANESNYYTKNGGISVCAGANEGAYTLLQVLGNVYSANDLDQWGKCYRTKEWFIENPFDIIIDLEESTGFKTTSGAKFYTQDEYNQRFEASLSYYEKTTEFSNKGIVGTTYVFGGFSGYSMLMMAAHMVYPDLFTLEEGQSSLQKWFDDFTEVKIDVTKEGGYYYTGTEYQTRY